jgi:hypothetical protein
MTTSGTQQPRLPQRDRNAEGRPENARPRDRFGRPLPRGSVDELGDRADPVQVVGSVAQALEHAVVLFDEQRFFEAHEFLEWAWKSDEVVPEDRNFWKGVTQVAVGLAHTQRGNTKGAVTLLQRAARYLRPYPSPHHGIDVQLLRTIALEMARRVEQEGASPDLDFPAFPLANT